MLGKRKVPNAHLWMIKQLFNKWHVSKVNFVDPWTTYVGLEAEIGEGTVIEPNVWIMGNTKIGKNCQIGFGSIIIDSTLEDNVEISGAKIEKSYVEHHAKLGFTAQIKCTRFGAYSKMPHHGYIGDGKVGQHVNIGAGVITSNYDGLKKNETVIEDYAFIGTNVNLVAPLTIPVGAMIAAGSTVTPKDELEPWRLFIARARGRLSASKRIRWDEEGWHIEEYRPEPPERLQ